ncbi:MAG TPA: DUF2993 domain-containing protein [Mycobacteriales bacterium]|nr:DUF2993 domain-containing protein [Mycobacteriales bacterium]
MLKGLVVSAAVVVGLAAVADLGLAAVAGSAVGKAVQRSEGMSEEPDVTFRGYPFVTQAVRGRFREVDVTARDVRVEGLNFTRVEADLRGVRVGLSDALAGEVEAVPVDSGTATVFLDYVDLNAYLESRPGSPRVTAGAGALVVRSSIGVPGRGSVPVEGTGTPRVTERGVVVTVTGVRALSGPALPVAAVASSAARLSFTISTSGLPFGITLQAVEVAADALRFSASARGVVIRTR